MKVLLTQSPRMLCFGAAGAQLLQLLLLLEPETEEGNKWLLSLCHLLNPHHCLPLAESNQTTAREHGKYSCQASNPL